VYVDNDDQLMLTWLEEQVLDIREQNIDVWAIATMDVTETVLVDGDGAGNALAVKWGT
jgi:hypothetical protein